MTTKPNRRTLISGLGVAAAAAAFGSSPVRAQSRGAFVPAHHTQDEWLDQVPGKHRVFIDSATPNGLSDALLFASNLFAGNKSGYGLTDGDVAIVVCMRHFSTPFAFNSDMWAKYGKQFAAEAKYTPPAGVVLTSNPHLHADRGMEVGIPGLTQRGAQFAICDMATHYFAGQVAKGTGSNADDIYKELAANIVANGHFVAAGVIGATRAQEYGYSLLVAG